MAIRPEAIAAAGNRLRAAAFSRRPPTSPRQFRIWRRRHLLFDRLLLLDDLRLAQPDIDLGGDQHDADEEEECADRALDEGHQVAARDQEAAPKVFLEARPEHETEQDRSRVEIEPQQDVTDNADEQCFTDL